MTLKAPMPYFGGKAKVASLVWARFGDVGNYIEPFAGSLAVLLARPHEPKTETVNDADAFLCLGPETRLLASDLLWLAAGEVQIGQELIGFDENNGLPGEGLRAPTHYRHWRSTKVTAVKRTIKPCYRLTFDDGTTVVASSDHLWLGGSHASGGRGWRWQRTDSLICNRATQRSWVLKLCDVTEMERSYEAGWLAGFYDGEGNLTSGAGWRMSVTQKLGVEADTAESLLRSRGFKTVRQNRRDDNPKHQPVTHIGFNGGMKETLRLLMLVRPERLIRKFQERVTDLSLYGRDHQAVGLVAKEFLGEQEVIAIETDSHTFVAEGLASHNCNFWRAVQADPEAVARWADWPVNETDLHARHLWLVTEGRNHVERLTTDPDYYDAKVAGWWVWGICQWIGSGWCSEAALRKDGTPWEQRPQLGNAGMGVHRKLPQLGNAGMGVHRKLPQLGPGSYGSGFNGGTKDLPANERTKAIVAYMEALAARLRGVRVCCGDWSRVCGPSPTFKHGMTAVFLDPPYSLEAGRDMSIYAQDSGTVAHDVRRWCLENGDNPLLRICLAGYAGEHEMPDTWEAVAWKAHGGYGSQAEGRGRENNKRETLWFSPACLKPDADLFAWAAAALCRASTAVLT